VLSTYVGVKLDELKEDEEVEDVIKQIISKIKIGNQSETETYMTLKRKMHFASS